MKTRFSSPNLSKVARADISCQFIKTRSLCRLFTKRMDFKFYSLADCLDHQGLWGIAVWDSREFEMAKFYSILKLQFNKLSRMGDESIPRIGLMYDKPSSSFFFLYYKLLFLRQCALLSYCALAPYTSANMPWIILDV